ncbi:MAG: hypothetical protein Q9197_006005 [Variospora fuerteventurae]
MAPAQQGARQRARRELRKAQLRSETQSLADLSVSTPYMSKFTETVEDQEIAGEVKDSPSGKISKENGIVTEEKLSGATIPLIENKNQLAQTAPPTGPRSTYARVVKDSSEQLDRSKIADVLQRFAGPAPPPLRGFPAFPQPNPQRQNMQLGSGRLQNTNKLGAHLLEMPR